MRDKIVISSGDLKATPLWWTIGEVEDRTYDGIRLFQQCHDTCSVQTGLPTEFFNHELMDVDTYSDASLIEFVSKWGLPYSPFRNAIFGYGEDKREILETIDETESIINREGKYKSFNTTEELDKAIEEPQKNPSTGTEILYRGRGNIISVSEARLTLRQLQESVYSIRKHLLATKYHANPIPVPYLLPINAGALNDKVIHDGKHIFITTQSNKSDISNRGFFMFAICDQVVRTIASPHPWKLCANKTCQKPFKHAHSASESTEAAKFCCSEHQNRQGRNDFYHRPKQGLSDIKNNES
jgi:hypothetical protein